MGGLNLPAQGCVYADAQVFIYSVEQHPVYAPMLRPLWEAVASGTLSVTSSELSLMETMIGPLRLGDARLVSDYEQLFQRRGIQLLPITRDVLYEAARLRAGSPVLRTPDALHAATARTMGCSLFLTNDKGFRHLPDLPLTLLHDL